MSRTFDSQKIASILRLMFAAGVSVLAAAPCFADDAPATTSGDGGGFFSTWLNAVSKIQAEQPHWVTPLVTVTPRLEQEYRYDQLWEAVPGGHTINNFDGGKGIEIIPALPVEVIIGLPAWQTEDTNPRRSGWTDQSFLLKYRLLTANKEEGDYILTAFMGMSIPDGNDRFSMHHFTYTPTIAFGKGWGDFDIQSTLGMTFPDNGAVRTGGGTPVLWNTAAQYHALKYCWPEVEANYTYWPNGEREGLNQLFITPGVLVGRIPLCGRLGLTFGAGVQVAVTDTPTSHYNVVLTARLPF